MSYRLVLAMMLALSWCCVDVRPASACSEVLVGNWALGSSAGVTASCGAAQVTSTVADGVRKTRNDPGASTNYIPQSKEPAIPAPMQKSCDDTVQNCPTILEPSAPATPAPATAGAPPVVTAAVLREAAASIVLPVVEPKVGPDPSLNPWGIVAIGYPIWLWTPGTDRVSSTVTAQGITVSIDARRTSTSFNMGDGTTIICNIMTPYPGPSNPPAESPTCGYRYQKLPATPGAGYDLRATTTWTVTWTALGQSGSFPMTRSAVRHLDVAEIQSVITAR